MSGTVLTDPQTGEVLTRPPVVIYHANCSDGFCSGVAAWLHFKGQGEYIPLVHDEAVPDVTGRDVYMLDIAFDLPQMERVSAQARRLTVLDHHQSAADDLRQFRCKCGQVLFDMTKSAARLSWEYFHPGVPVPALVAHVEDRDLVRWMLADSESYLASLDLGPMNFYRWAGVLRMPASAYEPFMQRGKAMRDQARKQARQIADGASSVRLAGVDGLMVNAPDLTHNLVGELLLERSNTFALMWCLERGGTRVKVGLRAGPAFNTIPLAKAFGGGGHPNASAFRMSLNRLNDLVQGTLEP